jgi:hypothetical protein
MENKALMPWSSFTLCSGKGILMLVLWVQKDWEMTTNWMKSVCKHFLYRRPDHHIIDIVNW